MNVSVRCSIWTTMSLFLRSPRTVSTRRASVMKCVLQGWLREEAGPICCRACSARARVSDAHAVRSMIGALRVRLSGSESAHQCDAVIRTKKVGIPLTIINGPGARLPPHGPPSKPESAESPERRGGSHTCPGRPGLAARARRRGSAWLAGAFADSANVAPAGLYRSEQQATLGC